MNVVTSVNYGRVLTRTAGASPLDTPALHFLNRGFVAKLGPTPLHGR